MVWFLALKLGFWGLWVDVCIGNNVVGIRKVV